MSSDVTGVTVKIEDGAEEADLSFDQRMVKCYLESVGKIGALARLPSSHKRDNKLTEAMNDYNCNGELQRYIANKTYSSYPSRVGNRDEEVKEQQGPKKKRERAKASSEASSEASDTE